MATFVQIYVTRLSSQCNYTVLWFVKMYTVLSLKIRVNEKSSQHNNCTELWFVTIYIQQLPNRESSSKTKLNIITVFYQLIKILSVCLRKCICEELKIVHREIRCISLFRMLCSFLYFEFNVVFMQPSSVYLLIMNTLINLSL